MRSSTILLCGSGLALVAAMPLAVAAPPPGSQPDPVDTRRVTISTPKPHVAELGVGPRSFTAPLAARVLETEDAESWCGHLTAGPPGARAVPVDFSAAAALVRHFSVMSAYLPSDFSLLAALAPDTSLTESGAAAALDAYAEPLDDACALAASPGTLGAASVGYDRDVAVVRPGTGTVALARRTSAVVVDLRDLPAAPGVGDAIRRAVAPALAKPVASPLSWVRAHDGPTDELFSPFNVYSTDLLVQDAPALPATGARDLPLVLLTSDHLSPEAARVAAELRIARRAFVVGSEVHSGVGESDWRGVGGHGLAVRTELLESVTGRSTQLDLRGQVALQDDPNDPLTSSYRRTFTVGDAVRRLDVRVDAREGQDLDLYVLRDANGDGQFVPDELVALSATPASDEHAQLSGAVPPGTYQAWVHGWYVPSGSTRFGLSAASTTAQTWPDVVPADAPGSPSSVAEAAAIARGFARAVPAGVVGTATRPVPVAVDPFGVVRATPADKGSLRAALLTAHGSARLFFPYFATVGDTIDSRLTETISSVAGYDGSDRDDARNILRRFGEALKDGHQFVINLGADDTVGYLPVQLEEIGGLPVVHTSLADGVDPGDTILSIDGRPTSEILAEELARTSPPTAGYRYDVAMRELLRMEATQTLELVDPAGVTQTVVVEPHPFADLSAAQDAAFGARGSGPLAELGAPDLYYFNLDEAATPSAEAARAAIAASAGAAGMILDMRGYPGGANHYEVASRLVPYPFVSPIFRQVTYAGPDVSGLSVEQYQLGPAPNPSWSGPIVLLTGPHAVSAAENFMQMLVGAGRVAAVVGQRSAGTNGNITGISLPGAFEFSYTGLEVINPDGSPFHGVGIVPDVVVPRAAADYRDGVDRDLLAGIAAMRAHLGD